MGHLSRSATNQKLPAALVGELLNYVPSVWAYHEAHPRVFGSCMLYDRYVVADSCPTLGEYHRFALESAEKGFTRNLRWIQHRRIKSVTFDGSAYRHNIKLLSEDRCRSVLRAAVRSDNVETVRYCHAHTYPHFEEFVGYALRVGSYDVANANELRCRASTVVAFEFARVLLLSAHRARDIDRIAKYKKVAYKLGICVSYMLMDLVVELRYEGFAEPPIDDLIYYRFADVADDGLQFATDQFKTWCYEASAREFPELNSLYAEGRCRAMRSVDMDTIRDRDADTYRYAVDTGELEIIQNMSLLDILDNWKHEGGVLADKLD